MVSYIASYMASWVNIMAPARFMICLVLKTRFWELISDKTSGMFELLPSIHKGDIKVSFVGLS